MGSIARMDPKIPLKCRDVSWPSPSTPSSKSFFQSDRPEPPSLNVNLKAEATWLIQMKTTLRLLCS